MNKFFKNRKLLIVTMHKKEEVIKPILEKYLDVKCIVVKNFNTDKFWTFSWNISRTWDMLDSARAKINAAIKKHDYDLVISSEGSFGFDKNIPFIQSNLELILLVDIKNNLEIRWLYQSSDTNMNGKYIYSIDEAVDFIKNCWFPEHWVIVSRRKKSKFFLFKNINTKIDLIKVVKKLFKIPFISKIYIETDMRAHKNPTRMKAIKLATLDLIKNIESTCPKCKFPGFIITNIKKWLLCKSCNNPTDIPIYEIYICKKCNYKRKNNIKKYGKFADPWECRYCNP